MGQPMMIHHTDGTQSVATDRGITYYRAELDLNRQYFWPKAGTKYGISIKWSEERQDAVFSVGNRLEEDGGVPAEIYDLADEAIKAFLAVVNRQATRMEKKERREARRLHSV